MTQSNSVPYQRSCTFLLIGFPALLTVILAGIYLIGTSPLTAAIALLTPTLLALCAGIFMTLALGRHLFTPFQDIRRQCLPLIPQPSKKNKGSSDGSGKSNPGNSNDTLSIPEEYGVAALVNAAITNLQTKNTFYERLLHDMPVPCMIYDEQDVLISTNQLMLDLLEYPGTPRDYLGKDSGAFLWKEPGRTTYTTLAIKQQKVLTAKREYPRRPPTPPTPISITAAPFSSVDGKMVLGATSIWIDQSEIESHRRSVEKSSQHMRDAAEAAAKVAESLSHASAQIADQVTHSQRGALTQRTRMDETSNAIHHLTDSVIKIAGNANDAADAAVKARSQAQDGASLVATMSSDFLHVEKETLTLKGEMDNLTKQANGIGEIINVISDIADQTNLLALNAAIEAARAGDAGRGFAVVADEVRKLAEKTMNATREVDNVIRGIQQSTGKSVSQMELTAEAIKKTSLTAKESGESLNHIVALVDSAVQQVSIIATVASEQSDMSKQISSTVATVHDIAKETSSAMDEAADAVVTLTKQSSMLQDIISKLQAQDVSTQAVFEKSSAAPS